MKKTKTQKGITLVALIITIVILLILAVVSITAITNEDILSYANNATIKYQQGKQNETNTLVGYEDWLNKSYGNGSNGGSGSTGGNSTGVNLLTISDVTNKDTYSVENGVLTLIGPFDNDEEAYYDDNGDTQYLINLPCTYSLKKRSNI